MQRIPFDPRQLKRWTFVCSLSAAPSFYLAYLMVQNRDIGAMVLGVALFICAYTVITSGSFYQRVRERARWFSALKGAYILRLAISVIMLGILVADNDMLLFIPDLYAGMVSTSIASGVLGQPVNPQHWTFVSTLLTTLIQGTLLNMIVLLVAGIFWLVLYVYSFIRPQRHVAKDTI